MPLSYWYITHYNTGLPAVLATMHVSTSTTAQYHKRTFVYYRTKQMRVVLSYIRIWGMLRHQACGVIETNSRGWLACQQPTVPHLRSR